MFKALKEPHSKVERYVGGVPFIRGIGSVVLSCILPDVVYYWKMLTRTEALKAMEGHSFWLADDFEPLDQSMVLMYKPEKANWPQPIYLAGGERDELSWLQKHLGHVDDGYSNRFKKDHLLAEGDMCVIVAARMIRTARYHESLHWLKASSATDRYWSEHKPLITAAMMDCHLHSWHSGGRWHRAS